MNLDSVISRAGGPDREQEWDTALSLSEQKLPVFIRILVARPQFAFLDRPGAALNSDQIKEILRRLSDHSIGYLMIGEAADPLDFYDAVLEIAEDGAWTWKELRPDARVDADARADG